MPIDYILPKVRQAVLGTLLQHPDRSWYLSDLAQCLELTPSSLQRELDGLQRAGVITRRKDGGRVYFQADLNCPFIHELQGLIRKTSGLVDLVKHALSPFASIVDSAYIYGSFANGAQISSASDVDILIVGRATMKELAPTVKLLEKTLMRPVNPTILSRSEFEDKLAHGNHFLRALKEAQRTLIIGDEDVFGAASAGTSA